MQKMTFPAMRHVLVNFTYGEAGENKQALVKLRICPRCGEKLNYRREKEREGLKHQQEKDEKRSKSQGRVLKLESSPRNSKKRRNEDREETSPRRSSSLSPSAPGGGSKVAGPTSGEENDDRYFKGMFP